VAPTKTGEAWVHQTIARLGRSLRQQGLSASRKAKLEALLGFWKARLQMKQLYQPLGPVAEWAETHYYQIPRKAQRASLIRPNRFWLALSRHRSGPFLSRYVVEASMHVNEMLLALAFVDLPYRTSQPISRMVGKKLTIRARTPMLLFARTIRAHAANLHAKDVLVRHYCYSRGKHSIQKKPKWQVMKLTSFSVVTCRAMVLNASNKARVFAVLMQLPKGAMPVSGSRSSYHLRVRLGGFQSRSFVYSFAFLAPGRFHQFPVHVSEKGRLVGYTKPFLYQVRAHTPQSNMRGWETIARFGKKREVLAYLRTKPIAGLAFGALSGRLSRRSFFLDVLAILKRRGVYAEAVWKHAFVHRYVPGIRTYLRFSSRVSSVIGGWFDSPWFSFDPIERSVYEFLEYSPLVYPRAHVQPGLWRRKHQDMLRHYKQLLKHLALKPRRDWASDDLLQVAYYLLLQGRMTEAIRWFRRVKTRGLATRLQYDYFRAYLQMTLARPERARAIALPYRAYPVKRWRRLFQMVLQHARESRQSAPTSRRARQALVLSTNQTPELRFSMFGSTLYIHARRTKRVTVSYHLMDVEWLFSRHPFGARYARGVRLLRPNATQSFRVSQKGMLRRRLPASLRNRNVMITVRAGSVSKRRLYYANSMLVSINPMTGIIDVRSQRMGRKLSKVYIKVYAKTGRYGRHTFYKDGYTDLRGKFQYLSRNDEGLSRMSVPLSSQCLYRARTGGI
jgi:tetratricopeptide (TPR) repeat protein